MNLVSSRLDPVTLKAWEESLTSTAFPSYRELSEFLSHYCQMLDSVAYSKSSQDSRPMKFQKQGRDRSYKARSSTGCYVVRRFQCSLCRDSHGIYFCRTILEHDSRSETASYQAKQVMSKLSKCTYREVQGQFM